MKRNVLMCKADRDPAKCGFACQQCYSYDVCTVDYCDMCKLPIDDWAEKYEDYHIPETGQDICCKCRKKIESEEILCHSTK